MDFPCFEIRTDHYKFKGFHYKNYKIELPTVKLAPDPDCKNVHASLALYWRLRLITFGFQQVKE
jgi:hypothetical protein